jgi:predicted DCC family thiol-disulfide oxidoreductase YuxK
MDSTNLQKPLILFDGVCGMCNTFVDLVLRADRKQTFLFAPLQGDTARTMLPAFSDDPREWSMVYVDEAGIHDQSDASLEVYRRLRGFWWLLSLARYVPRFIRTPIYRLIARNRYRWFGKREQCRVPTPDERARFLP